MCCVTPQRFWTPRQEEQFLRWHLATVAWTDEQRLREETGLDNTLSGERGTDDVADLVAIIDPRDAARPQDTVRAFYNAHAAELGCPPTTRATCRG